MSAPHVMILASAGSGKTYALTNRFVALLARGAAPERIVALTFTRKAAGEFFDEILNKLARAATDETAAQKLAGDIREPALRTGDFLRMLRAVVDAMHRLKLGTLDSFFARIARTFPFELGLAGEFEVLQEHAARIERRRVLQRMFTHSGELEAEQREFVEAFKRATFGTEEKQLGPRLDAFIDAHHETYLSAPGLEAWGNEDAIWPDGQPWLREVNLTPAVAALRRWLVNAGLAEKQRGRWENFLAAVETWSAGAPMPAALDYVLAKALAAWTELGCGKAELKFDRKPQALDGPACAALGEIVCHIAGGELRRRLATTRGIHAVLRGYDQFYHAAVRRAGKLTFADVQRLLTPEREDAWVLTREAGAEGRLFIDYRLDAEIDHWLLDEFQDTSYGQWSVLRNLIDEAVQDAEGRRSFFCVGDVKQAIFAWREGDPRLFRDIFEHYNNAAPGAIVEEHLDASWRSGPALIEMVNAVFGARIALEEFMPGAASAAWNREWRDHVSAVPERTGQAALLHAADEEGRRAMTLQLVQELDPLGAGLTCAVLVRTNTEAAALADYLRHEGNVPAVAESDLAVCADNPCGAALLALFQAAAHPGDTLAWEHVQMTPLAALAAEWGIATPEALTTRVLREVHADGFERTADRWLHALKPRLKADDEFTRLRMRQFTAAAALFDATGSKNVAEFVAFMQTHREREPESAAMVRVMTIHKSKGLGFDVVIVPDLEGDRVNQAREGLAVKKRADRSVEWVLDLPTKIVRESDPVLARFVSAAEDEAGYEALSLLYVAMTRAKRAMYLITKPVGDSSSRNFPKLLALALGEASRPVRVGRRELSGAWASGDPDWRAKFNVPARPAGPTREIPALPSESAAPSVRPVARRASGEKGGLVPAAQVFALTAAAAAELGTAVHGLLAQVEWLEPGGAARLRERWAEEPVGDDALNEAWRCVQAADLADVWTPPSGAAEVWRERAFEILLDDVWITGVFDRVIVRRDAAGQAQAAVVFDFKTDRVSDAADIARAVERHTPQLALYRRVVAVLTGLAPAGVRAELVFSAMGARAAVPA